ncbi:MAG TPA: hypothetical protein PL143_09420 [Rhodocyclaceae bacterium]|nr:hypothetical protein [Rhodocyclaceae bacterium]
MESVTLTASHWVFLGVILAIFASIAIRKDVVIPSIIGVFILGLLAASGNGAVNTAIGGVQVMFKAFLNAGEELFDIMLVIALMVAMLKSLQAQGADVLMISPVKRLMVNPWSAFFVLGATMYIAASFFWPTPAVALVGVILIPIAVQVGLPAMGAAVAINLFGHGMALSGDLVIQGATRLTATSAGLQTTDILPYTALFSLTVGVVSIAVAFVMLRRDMRNGTLEGAEKVDLMSDANAVGKPVGQPAPNPIGFTAQIQSTGPNGRTPPSGAGATICSSAAIGQASQGSPSGGSGPTAVATGVTPTLAGAGDGTPAVPGATIANGVKNFVSNPDVRGPYAKFFAIGVPVVLFSIVMLMIYRAIFDPAQAIRGGAATALLGGTAVILLLLSTCLHEGTRCFERIVDHVREGFFFAIKIFAPIIPIAGFFFLGHPKHAATVLGEGTPGFLFDLGKVMGTYIQGNDVVLAIGIALIGLLTGMDGSGFSGLPLVGGLAGSLGSAAGVNVAVLASLGQVAAIFAGGGTLCAWAFGVAADAGIAGVKPIDLVRRNFVPVMAGMAVACVLAIYLM